MCAIHRARENAAVDGILLAMIAEVLLVCATALGFFVQLDLPIAFATGGALAVLFIGSVFCWKSRTAASAILALSLAYVQIMLITRFPILLLPFALVDVITVMIVSGVWHTGEQARAP
ncbi:MAG: hypothetical protein NTX79_08130 [Candidatus Micrarchaeota archaeon]|nr:hypothetical protein [Candidatus Micrarchaeota archaeon]